MKKAEKLIFNSDLARRYKEFGHIGLNTPFYIVNIGMKDMLEPLLYDKYQKAQHFIESKEKKSTEAQEPIENEDFELYKKLSSEYKRHFEGVEKIFTEEDFIYNYEEHYPEIADEKHETKYRQILGKMTGDYDIPKFMKSKKPKSKKLSGDIIIQDKPDPVVEIISTPEVVTVNPIITVRKVKGKNKRHR